MEQNKINELKELKEKFDSEIKNSLIEKYNGKFGYIVKGDSYHRDFPNYFNNCTFCNFIKEMPERIYLNYFNGDGGEFNVKKGRNGRIDPPKMASVASSSRFMYLTFRDSSNISKIDRNIDPFTFEFEKRNFKIKETNSTPNYDGYCKNTINNIDYFFEAKCHELFDSHELKWGIKYRNCCEFDNDSIEKISNSKMYLKKSVFDLENEDTIYLDVKQYISHLLGIRSYLGNTSLNHPAKCILMFIYFVPTSILKMPKYTDIYLRLINQFNKVTESNFVKRIISDLNIEIKLKFIVNNTMEDCVNSLLEPEDFKKLINL